MATIVGFDANRLKRFVISVHYNLIFNEDGTLNENQALKVLYISAIVETSDITPTPEMTTHWMEMDNADFFLQFDDLPSVHLVAVFDIDAETRCQ